MTSTMNLSETLNNKDIVAMKHAIEDGRITAAHVFGDDTIEVTYIDDNGDVKSAKVTLPELRGGWGMRQIVDIEQRPDQAMTQRAKNAVKNAVGFNKKIAAQQKMLAKARDNIDHTMPERESEANLAIFHQRHAIVEPLAEVKNDTEEDAMFGSEVHEMVDSVTGKTIEALKTVGSGLWSITSLGYGAASGITRALIGGATKVAPKRETIVKQGSNIGRALIGGASTGLQTAYTHRETVADVLKQSGSAIRMGTVQYVAPALGSIIKGTSSMVVTGGHNLFKWAQSSIIENRTKTNAAKAAALVSASARIERDKLALKETAKMLQKQPRLHTRKTGARMLEREIRVVTPRPAQKEIVETVRKNAAPTLVRVAERPANITTRDDDRYATRVSWTESDTGKNVTAMFTQQSEAEMKASIEEDLNRRYGNTDPVEFDYGTHAGFNATRSGTRRLQTFATRYRDTDDTAHLYDKHTGFSVTRSGTRRLQTFATRRTAPTRAKNALDRALKKLSE